MPGFNSANLCGVYRKIYVLVVWPRGQLVVEETALPLNWCEPFRSTSPLFVQYLLMLPVLFQVCFMLTPRQRNFVLHPSVAKVYKGCT